MNGRVLSEIFEFHIHWLHYVLVQLFSKKSMKMYSIVLDALIFIADRICYYMYNDNGCMH